MCHSSRDLLLLWTEELVPRNEPWMYICTIVLSNYNGRQVPRSKRCNTVWYICHIRFVWLDSINTSSHVSLYALCVPARLLYAIVHWLSFRHMSSYECITKQAILRSTFFSRRSIWVLLELIRRWTQHLTKINQEKCKIEQICIWNPRTTGFIM